MTQGMARGMAFEARRGHQEQANAIYSSSGAACKIAENGG